MINPGILEGPVQSSGVKGQGFDANGQGCGVKGQDSGVRGL